MTGREETESGGAGGERPVLYCLIPTELAPKLHDLLRHHFAAAGESSVRVVVEQRRHERRTGRERRTRDEPPPGGEERRRIRSATGRRIGDRRAALLPVPPDEAPELPRRARRYADRISFVERLEPAGERDEDLDTGRVVTRFQAGEPEAFTVLYTRYFDRVYGYLRVALRDQHDAEDATQGVFTRVFEALPEYERRGQPFRHWLFAIARNYALTQLRGLGRIELEENHKLERRREDAALEEPPPTALDWVSDPDLMIFIGRLPPAQRQILALRYMLGLTHKETAELLGRSMDDVKSQHHRAVTFLRERLRAIGRGPESKSRRRAGATQVFRPAEVLRHRRFMLR